MTNWCEVADRYGPVVWKTAYRLLGNEADAADCFQETFLAAVRLVRAETVNSWGGLLRRLAVARAVEAIRRRVREGRRRGDVADWGLLAGSGADPSEHAQGTELAERLREGVGLLPRRQAEVFCLRCLEEMSYEQIAAELGLRANAVGVLLHRARRQLRRMLTAAPAGKKG